MLRLFVDAEGRETAVIRGAEALLRDVLRGGHEVAADLLGRLDFRIKRGDHTDEANLRNTGGVLAAMPP